MEFLEPLVANLKHIWAIPLAIALFWAAPQEPPAWLKDRIRPESLKLLTITLFVLVAWNLYLEVASGNDLFNHFKCFLRPSSIFEECMADLLPNPLHSNIFEDDRESAEKQIKIAQQNMQQEQLDDAERRFKYAVSLCGSCDEAHLGLGDVYAKRKQFADAQTEYNHALSLNGRNAKAYLGLGNIELAFGKGPEANNDFQSALTLDGTVASQVHEGQGDALRLMNQPQKALDEYDAALKEARDPEQIFDKMALAYLYEGRALSNERKFDDAIVCLNKGLALRPLPSLYAELGIVRAQQRRFPEAIEALNQAISGDAVDADFYNARGVTYLTMGRYSEADRDLTEALKLKPNMADAFKNKGLLSDAIAQPEAALAAYRDAVRLLPQFPEAFRGMASAYELLGQTDDALNALNHALDMKPHYSQALIDRGNIRLHRQNTSAALDDFNAAVASAPDFPEAYLVRGFLFNKIGGFGKAVSDLSNYIRLAMSQNVKIEGDTYKTLGDAYASAGNNDSAVDSYAMAIAIAPDKDSDAYKNKANAELASNHVLAAIDDFGKAIQLSPKFLQAHRNLARAYAMNSQCQLAKNSIETALSISPNDPISARIKESVEAEDCQTTVQQPENSPIQRSTVGSGQNSGEAPDQGSASGNDQQDHATSGSAELTYYSCLAVAPHFTRKFSVSFDVGVQSDGSVDQVKITKSSGDKEMDDLAVQCVKNGWTFNPAIQGGKRVASIVSYEDYTFHP